MFPYPSGKLHLGHLRVYTISDVIARFKYMQGHEVIHPMGWDAFGLPAENAAIERGVDPRTWTLGNIAKMKEQITVMGGRWDWDRELMTCDPNFYKHTQHLFLELHRHDLAYQAESLVNFDPVDKTVLANEQVDADGCSWRSGAKVQKLLLRQWFLRITAFKEALFDDLEPLSEGDRWPERVISMQRNWLGKSSGARIRFPIRTTHGSAMGHTNVDVFTTRPDTLFGVQYLALSTAHPITKEYARRSSKLRSFLDAAPGLPPDSKDAFQLADLHAVNPLSLVEGMPEMLQSPLPVYVAPYVLGNYGEGAVMGVPGHDVRDHGFWLQHATGASTRFVIQPKPLDDAPVIPDEPRDGVFTDRGVLTSLCGPFTGLNSEEASEAIIEVLRRKGEYAELANSWRLRDWLISRQRYWGTPIPIIHCEDCGAVPVPQEQLPVELPSLTGNQLRGTKGNPLEHVQEWVNTSCPKCGGPAKRETDTMDTFVDSSWYYMRFADPHNKTSPFSSEGAEATMPVDVYLGGVEHAILHLLYARFISKFLTSISMWPSGGGPSNRGEPFKRMITQGMVHGKTYTDPVTGRFLSPAEVDLSDPMKPRVLDTGEIAKFSYEKMSKSKHNGIDPGACIAKHGADATRAHILFQAPVTEILEWDEDRIVGIHRWLHRVWRIVWDIQQLGPSKSTDEPLNNLNEPQAELWSEVQTTIEDVTTALDKTYSLNTVVSSLIKLTNKIASSSPSELTPELYQTATCTLLKMMAPITPAFVEECWATLLKSDDAHPPTSTSIFDEPWPEPDRMTSSTFAAAKKQACAVQINGKLRFVASIPQAPRELFPEKREDKGVMKQQSGEEKLRKWILKEIVQSEEGRAWFEKMKGTIDVENAKRVVVVRGGQTVNFVF